MSAAPGGDANTTKATVNDANTADKAEEVKKPAGTMDGDDEWEEFPSSEWTEEDQELPGGNTHLWEAGWDDDVANNEFVKQLKNAQAFSSSEKDLATNKPVEKNSKESDQGKEAKPGTQLSTITEALEPDLADYEDLDGDKEYPEPRNPTTVSFKHRP